MAELQTTWGWMIAVYLFLGGIAGGAFCVTSIVRLAGKGRFKSTLTFGAWLATITLAIGLIFLVADVEKPLQAMVLFQSFVNFSSWMTIGAWLLLLALVIFVLAAVFSTDRLTQILGKLWRPLESSREKILKILAIIGIPTGLAVALYTGILLGGAPSIPLWNTWLLPVLFTVSALDTGIASVLIFMVIKEKDQGVNRVHLLLERGVIVLVALELIVLGVYLAAMLGGSVGQAIAAELIISGPLSIAFWALVVVIGLLIPLSAAIIEQIKARNKKSGSALKAVPIISALCALLGGFTLRYVILAAGIHGVMISPEAVQALKGIFFFVS